MDRPPIRLLLLGCFFLSGASSLIYEVVWLRLLTLQFGSTTLAVSAVLAAFMAGLALGSFLLGRVADRLAEPLLAYGLLELAIAVYALAVPTIFAQTEAIYARAWSAGFDAFALNATRFALALAVLTVPTTLMGGTLPVLAGAYAAREGAAGRDLGTLYGVNTWGAVAGAAAAGFFLLPSLGQQRATRVAILLNLLIALAAFLAGRKVVPSTRGRASSARRTEGQPSRPLARPAVLVAFALSGLAAMVYEVAWTRLLTLVLGSSTYAFTTMLVTFLAGIAGGSLMGARAADRLARPRFGLAVCLMGIGLAAFATQHLFSLLPRLFLAVFPAVRDAPGLLRGVEFGLAALVVLPATFLMGAAFPLVACVYADVPAHVGRLIGEAYAANTVGTIAGALLAGFVAIPLLGIAGAVTAGIALNMAAGLGLLLMDAQPARDLVSVAMGSLVLLALTMTSPPPWDALVLSSGVYKEAPTLLRLYPSGGEALELMPKRLRTLYYREGVSATVLVAERPSLEEGRQISLAIDGKVDASTGADMPTQVLSAHLPLLLHPKPRQILVVGVASGVTVGSVLRHPVAAVVAVEIEPAVIEASKKFVDFNSRYWEDPRLHLVLEDARNYLLASTRRFDVIISEPSNPWLSGPAKLFTLEYFRLGARRLSPGGIFAQWIQMYGLPAEYLRALVRTFHEVFPHVLVFQTNPSDLLLLGSTRPIAIEPEALAERSGDPSVARDLVRVRVRDWIDLLAHFILGGEAVRTFAGAGPLNTDENGLIEFGAPRFLHADTISANRDTLARAFNESALGPLAPGVPPGRREALLLVLGRGYLQAGRLRQAEVSTRAALAHRESAEGHWMIGELAANHSNGDAAAHAWQRALALDPRHPGTLAGLGLLAYLGGRPAEAEDRLGRAAAAVPRDGFLRYLHGIALYAAGRLAAARAELLESLRLGLGDRPPPSVLARPLLLEGVGATHLAHYFLAVIGEKLGDPAAADHREAFGHELDGWRAALERRPAESPRLPMMDRLAARAAAGAVRPEEAALADLMTRRVARPLTHYYEGTTLYFLGYDRQAARELGLALQSLHPDQASPLTHYYLGLAQLALNEPQVAASHLEAFLRGSGHRGEIPARLLEAYRGLERAYTALGDADRARETRERRAALAAEGASRSRR